jgi:hypothetical protein
VSKRNKHSPQLFTGHQSTAISEEKRLLNQIARRFSQALQ